MAPTFDVARRFERDRRRLKPDQQDAFRDAASKLVADLKAGVFRKGLRIKGIRGAPGVFEMTWAPNGRATFEFGQPLREGQPHVIWRRVGTHDIFAEP